MSVLLYILTDVIPAFIGGVLGALAVFGVWRLRIYIKEGD